MSFFAFHVLIREQIRVEDHLAVALFKQIVFVSLFHVRTFSLFVYPQSV